MACSRLAVWRKRFSSLVSLKGHKGGGRRAWPLMRVPAIRTHFVGEIAPSSHPAQERLARSTPQLSRYSCLMQQSLHELAELLACTNPCMPLEPVRIGSVALVAVALPLCMWKCRHWAV